MLPQRTKTIENLRKEQQKLQRQRDSIEASRTQVLKEQARIERYNDKVEKLRREREKEVKGVV
jgi:septal ring factor EnvC (AmiA/AmiB activator)